MYRVGIDNRQIEHLKVLCGERINRANKNPEDPQTLDLHEFISCLDTVLNQANKEVIASAYKNIIDYVKDPSNLSKVPLSRIATLLEFYLFLPVVVKKDKNLSPSIYYILNANKSPSHKTNL
jgi:hypothetical protein